MATFTSNVNTGKLRSTSVTSELVEVNAGDNTKIDVQIEGYIIDADTGARTDVSVNETAVTVPLLATQIESYMLVDSTGSLVFQAEPPSLTQMSTHLTHWVIVHADLATVQFINRLQWNSEQLGDQVLQFFELIKYLKNGLSVGPGTTGLRITRDPGVLFRKGIGETNQTKNTDEYLEEEDLSYQLRLSDGTVQPDSNVINPTVIESPLGTLGTVSANNKYTVKHIFMFPSGQVRIQPGQKEYNSLAEALDGIDTDTFILEDNIRRNAVLLGWLAIRKSTTNWSDASKFAFKTSSTTGAGGTVSITPTMQNGYDISDQPQIETNSGAVQYKQGVSDTDATQEWLDTNDNVTAKITGEGRFESVKQKWNLDFTGALNPLEYEVPAFREMSIESVVDIVDTPTTTITVNAVAYTLGDTINVGDVINVTVSTASAITLNIDYTI